jgi:hypothetical protein
MKQRQRGDELPSSTRGNRLNWKQRRRNEKNGPNAEWHGVRQTLGNLFADFFDDVSRNRADVAAGWREFWRGFLWLLYFALAFVFVSHGG